MTLINNQKLEFLPCQLSILDKVMISASQAQITCQNPRVNTLLLQIAQQKTNLESTLSTKVKQDRKMYHSNSTKTSRSSFIQRPLFNNKTKEGELLDMEFKPVPYLFVPGHKNDTFIMPDRVFQKGKAGKRFFIKMKDTAIYSFRQSQGERMSQVLHKKEKQETIISRQNEQYNKIINENDGKLKAQLNKWFLKTRKRFDPAHGRQLFSECEPMLQPKDPQTVQIRKTSLSKTYDFRNKWRPATRGAQAFSATTSVSNYHQHYASSVR